VFAGIVGTSGSRREYSVLGDKVNLSARLMGHSIHSVGKNILCDRDIMIRAGHKIDFIFSGKKAFKGKKIETEFYEPVFHN